MILGTLSLVCADFFGDLIAAEPFDAPPTILVQPTSVVTRAGTAVIFSVNATGAGPLSFQWLKNGQPIGGQTSSVLALTDVRQSDAAIYRLIISNAYGSVTSVSASLTVTTPLLFTQEPSDQSVKAGANATFRVLASSLLPLNYVWFKDGNLLPGAITNVLFLKNVQVPDAGAYTATAYTTEGSLQSRPAILFINGALPPQIITHPTNQIRLVGTDAAFAVWIVGGLPFSYQWFKNGLVITNAVNSNLVLNLIREFDAGRYHVVVTNSAGQVSSSTATLLVQVPPSITVQPTNRTAFAGATVTITVQGTGTPSPAVQWFRDGVAIPNAISPSLILGNVQRTNSAAYHAVLTNVVGSATSVVTTLTVQVPATIRTQPLAQTVFIGRTATFAVDAIGDPLLALQWFKGTNSIPGATNATLVLTNAQLPDAGVYRVTVTNEHAKVVSADALLTVNVPVIITTQPTNQAVRLGSNAAFSVRATGFGALTYSWIKNGKPVLGATEPDLRISKAQVSDAGEYAARVIGDFGGATSSVATLTVNVPAIIQAQPQSRRALVGTSIRLAPEVIGTLPLSYRWFKNDSVIVNATNAFVELLNLRFSDEGDYRFVVTNAFGVATSLVARVIIDGPPAFRDQPVNQSAVIGSSASFVGRADGSPPMQYQWYKDGVAISGASDWLLVLRDLRLSDAGTYRLYVRNGFGNAESSSATLLVGLAAVISFQPFDQVVTVGSPATFGVAAEGTEPLSYQWFREGVALRGATNSVLTLSAVKRADAGRYTVSASNLFGQARSADAVLNVRTPLATKGDFDGNGSPDIVFQNQAGQLASWRMKGIEMITSEFLGPGEAAMPEWGVVGSADFDRDGNEDLFLQHKDRALALWFMDRHRLTAGALLKVDVEASKNWIVAGTGDFNQDSKPDLVARAPNGRLAIWFLEDLTVGSSALLNLGNPVAEDWTVVGTGDFNEDGKSDLLFQHHEGELAVWYLDGTQTTSTAFLNPRHPGDALWRVVGIADRNGDGMPDLLFQHQDDGTLAVWLMDGIRLSGARLLNPSSPGGTWRVVAP